MRDEPGSPNSQTDIRAKRMGFHGPLREIVAANSIASLKPSTSLEPLRRPVSFQSLVQLQSSSSSTGSDLTSHRSESNLLDQANAHKKSQSFDSRFLYHGPLYDSNVLSTAKGKQNEVVSPIQSARPGNPIANRPRNPVAAPWSADFSFPAELPASKHLVANDLTANLSIPPFQNPEPGLANQRNLSVNILRRASQEDASARPAVTFSEIESNRTSVRRKVVMTGDAFCGKSALLS